jgi:hypothetical protein
LIPATDKNIANCKAILARLAATGAIALDANGLPKRSPTTSASQAFELMAKEPDAPPYIEALHRHFLAQGIWIWKRGTIEAHIGLQSKSASDHQRFIRSYSSEPFRLALPDYAGLKSLLSWMKP